jgi:hypothetical protein
VEAIYEAALLSRCKNDFENAYIYAKKGSDIEPPTQANHDASFFSNATIYRFGIWDELSISAFYYAKLKEGENRPEAAKKLMKECIAVTERLFQEGRVPKDQEVRVKNGLEHAKKELERMEREKYCRVIYLKMLN